MLLYGFVVISTFYVYGVIVVVSSLCIAVITLVLMLLFDTLYGLTLWVTRVWVLV